MARTCRLVRDGRGVDATWRRDADVLVVSPAGAAPLTLALEEVSGISGDGFTVALRLPDGEIALERLGGNGPTLLQELRRDWPALRASVLRLAGGGTPGQMYSGVLEAPAARGPFRCFLAGDRLVVAPDGGDVFALFIADAAATALREDESLVELTGWDGTATRFRGLGAATSDFAGALAAAREALAVQAAAAVSGHLPTLSAGSRARLAVEWVPGRLMSFAQLEAIAPGFEAAFRASWLAQAPRAASGAELMEGLPATDRLLGYAGADDGEEPFVWLLARRSGAAFLEALTQEDYATYQFRDDAQIVRLVEELIRLPEFSREALYLPLDQLTGERAVYAIPARDLPMLRGLRERFSGRKIHAVAGS